MADWKKLAKGKKGVKDAGETPPAKSLEESCRDELTETEQAFRARIGKEDKRKRDALDSEYWFAVVFINREEKMQFLRKYGLDKLGDKYLSGGGADKILQKRLADREKDAHKRRI